MLIPFKGKVNERNSWQLASIIKQTSTISHLMSFCDVVKARKIQFNSCKHTLIHVPPTHIHACILTRTHMQCTYVECWSCALWRPCQTVGPWALDETYMYRTQNQVNFITQTTPGLFMAVCSAASWQRTCQPAIEWHESLGRLALVSPPEQYPLPYPPSVDNLSPRNKARSVSGGAGI